MPPAAELNADISKETRPPFAKRAVLCSFMVEINDRKIGHDSDRI